MAQSQKNMSRMLAAFDAAAVDFSRLSPHLWDRVAHGTVEVSRPQLGEWVLDACCGDGASAIPAARLVGPSGRVDAVDLSSPLVDAVTRSGAELSQLSAHHADVTAWTGLHNRIDGEDGGRPYDLVQSVLGIFFFPDMAAGTEHLISLLRPGGRVALTIWRRGSMAEVGNRLAAAAAQVRGEPAPGHREPHLVERIGNVRAYDLWLGQRGLRDTRVVKHDLAVSLTAEIAWLLVIGSGFRSTLQGLVEAQVAAVRDEYLGALDRDGITEVDATTLVGTGLR